MGSLPVGHETILLVEDDEAVREMAGLMLTELGYQVLVASNGEAALNIATERAGTIQLLLTDVVMPKMNGRDLAGNLLSHYPNLKCLFMSGYTADVIAPHGMLQDDVQFIQKPFSSVGLLNKVRAALDALTAAAPANDPSTPPTA